MWFVCGFANNIHVKVKKGRYYMSSLREQSILVLLYELKISRTSTFDEFPMTVSKIYNMI